MKKLIMCLIILILLLPSTAFAHNVYDRIQIQGDINVSKDEIVTGDVVAIIGDVTVDGEVMGDVVAVIGDIIINGQVMGDVVAIGGRVTRSDTSKIHGKVTQIEMGQGIHRVMRNFIQSRPRFGLIVRNASLSVFNLVRFLGTIALSALCIILFPNGVKIAAESVTVQPGRKFLIGLVALLITPLVIGLMIITLFGIPLVPLAILLLAAAGFFGYIGISIYLGRRLNEHLHFKTGIFAEYILGAVLLRLVQQVPLVGSLASILVLLLSIGIATDTLFGTKTIG